MSCPSGCVEFGDVEVLAESDKAVLCDVEGEEVWIPKSQIHDDSEVYAADTSGRLVVTEWIARQKGIL